jgi:hypothetical protein
LVPLVVVFIDVSESLSIGIDYSSENVRTGEFIVGAVRPLQHGHDEKSVTETTSYENEYKEEGLRLFHYFYYHVDQHCKGIEGTKLN